MKNRKILCSCCGKESKIPVAGYYLCQTCALRLKDFKYLNMPDGNTIHSTIQDLEADSTRIVTVEKTHVPDYWEIQGKIRQNAAMDNKPWSDVNSNY